MIILESMTREALIVETTAPKRVYTTPIKDEYYSLLIRLDENKPKLTWSEE